MTIDSTTNEEAVDEVGEEETQETRGRGRPRKELPGIGDNIKGLIPDILAAIELVDGLGVKRNALNQKVQAAREDLFAKGIPKEVFDLIRHYREWPEDKRRIFDLAFACCREAIGEPIQSDFLDQLKSAK